MSLCGSCGGTAQCTCAIIGDSSVTIIGNGASSTPFSATPTSIASTRPLDIATRYTQLAIPQNVATAVTFTGSSSAIYTSGMWNAAQPTRLTIPVTGKYLVGAAVGWDSTASTGTRIAYIDRNGALTALAPAHNRCQDFGNSSMQTMRTLLSLVAGDYLEVVVLTSMPGEDLLCQLFDTYLWAAWEDH